MTATASTSSGARCFRVRRVRSLSSQRRGREASAVTRSARAEVGCCGRGVEGSGAAPGQGLKAARGLEQFVLEVEPT